MNPTNPINLVIVEDGPLIREQLLRLVAGLPDVQVAAVATTEDDAVMAILERRPDVVLLDLALAAGSGLYVLRRIRRARSTARVLVLSNHTGEALRQRCEALGVDGFYDKSVETGACLERLCAMQSPHARAAQ